MHAHGDMRVRGVAPFGVGDAVKGAVAEGMEITLLHRTMVANDA